MMKATRARYTLEFKQEAVLVDERTVEHLRPFAHYIWWKSAEDALRRPERLVAQVMNLGSYDDVCLLSGIVSEEELRSILRRAEIGEFTPRSWHYWHYRLGLADPQEVPPMPARKTA